MGRISADTFRRIYLLFLLGQFQKGSFGLVRLQKVVYTSERESLPRPFTYKRHHFGEYSEQLDDIKDQLASMGYIGAVPLDTATTLTIKLGDTEWEVNMGGNRLFLREARWLEPSERVLNAVSGSLPTTIRHAVRDYGYLKERDLLERCYQFPEFQSAGEGDTIFDSDLPAQMDIDLPDDECDDLEISLNPKFVNSMTRLTDILNEREIPWDRIPKLERLPVPGS